MSIIQCIIMGLAASALFLYFGLLIGYHVGSTPVQEKLKAIKVEKVKGLTPDYTVTIITPKGITTIFRGNYTVWHVYPSGERASTQQEVYLTQVWTSHAKWDIPLEVN